MKSLREAAGALEFKLSSKECSETGFVDCGVVDTWFGVSWLGANVVSCVVRPGIGVLSWLASLANPEVSTAGITNAGGVFTSKISPLPSSCRYLHLQ